MSTKANAPAADRGAAENTLWGTAEHSIAIPTRSPLENQTQQFIVLNDRWRVRENRLQWILEHRQSGNSAKSTGYRGRRYCTQRFTLKRSIDELCGMVDPAALQRIKELPSRHPHKMRGRYECHRPR